MRTLPLRGIVFDFDGTLAVPALSFQEMGQAAVNAVAALMPDYPPKEEPALEWLLKVASHASRQGGEDFAAKVCRAADLAMGEVEVAAAKRGGLFPGVLPMLQKLREHGIKTGIITRNCTRAVAAAFGPEFKLLNCVLSRDDISQWKPDPAHLQAALIQMELSPEHTLMIGDDPMDILVGKKCKTRTAAVFCGHVPKEVLLACQPDFCAEDCAGLMLVLEEAGLLFG